MASSSGDGRNTDAGGGSSASVGGPSTAPPPAGPSRVTGSAGSGYADTPAQLYAAPAQPAGRLEYEAYAALARRTLNSLSDRARQAVMDVIAGPSPAAAAAAANPDPVLEAVNAELWQRRDEYSTKRDVTILTGTYNVNAKGPGESLLPWLLPETLPNEPDIIALAFQEVVPLTPQQILLTDPSRLWVWENAIMEAINRRSQKQADYAFVRSEQLVGTALLVLVKTNLLHNVRQVESATKKTGLRGMSGNKGGVAIRFKLFDSTLCFVTAHLAAGQGNVDQRNDDYRTISSGLVFPQGMPIGAHDHIFWFGDFNYRVDIPNERARWLAENDDYTALMAKDQLKRSQEAQQAFVGFTEGQLGFRPTYKYDNGTSTYDTSEKQRVPAWTDRVLFRGHGLQQLIYARAELYTSDHRPVYAFFEAELRVFDQKRRKEVLSEIMSRRRTLPGRTLGSMQGLSSESEDEDLPGPSSDHFSWWDLSGPESDSDTSSDSDEGPMTNPFQRGAGARPAPPSSNIGNGTASYAAGSLKRRAPPPPLPDRSSRASSPSASQSTLTPLSTALNTPDSAPPVASYSSSTTIPTAGGSSSYVANNNSHAAHAMQTASPPGPQRRVPPPIPQKPSLSSLGMPSSGPASSVPVGVRPWTGAGPPRRPGFVRSKSATSTRSLLTDSE
ncbi:Inositol-1,4,5-trisphosphate 5-phosphatase 1 [Tilletia horrida]|nr:Inositol-1,4,5-trisphosphate 5-phosphatase 1 [Tilletia horrida]